MIMQNLSLLEKLTYHPILFGDPATQEKILDALAKLQAFEGLDEEPEDLASRVEDLEEKSTECNDGHHCHFDDYKAFFEDVMRTIEDYEGYWPCAEPWQSEVLMRVREIIEAGCEALASGED